MGMSESYLGLDPGPDTGWASANESGQLISYGQILLEDLPDFLEGMVHIHTAVCEDYIVRSQYRKAHYNKPVKTSEAIGIIRSWATRHKITLIMQAPDKLQMGARMTGMSVPGGKAHKETHWIAGWNHLQYWMIKQGIAKSLLEWEYESKHGRREGNPKESGDPQG